ncbi:hypothetical protein [Natrialba sp. SSL1]|uniref:hypothetical protein n=1 Tax=Natrialba sp. SSL1 TaxID=1869245 RepID=UPI0008F917A4|nr:hypothetical protein [Natrialba sp. SSL1]OIB58292.1 hypothetical protein BBD46_08165 [Natrialba sp. SSL1]
MNRRTILKRASAAGLGVATIGAGSAAARNDDPEVRRVEIDGETYLVFGDATVDDLSEDDLCTCDNCDPVLCDWCGPCR